MQHFFKIAPFLRSLKLSGQEIIFSEAPVLNNSSYPEASIKFCLYSLAEQMGFHIISKH